MYSPLGVFLCLSLQEENTIRHFYRNFRDSRSLLKIDQPFLAITKNYTKENVVGIVSKITETVESKLKNSQRVINLKLPTYEDCYALPLLINGYKIYSYDAKSCKIHFQKPLYKKIFDIISWVLQCILFGLECCFAVPIQLSTVLSLFNRIVDISLPINENVSQTNVTFLRQLSKHLKIRKKPSKKVKKIKKIIYIQIDENTTNELRYSVDLLADLIEQNYINNCSLVILSKIAMQSPAQEILNYCNDEEKNRFISEFKEQFLNDILSEDFNAASNFIQKILNADSLRVSEFEFVMQCLAFCYKNMNESEFINLFSQSGLKINEDLHVGKTHNFITTAGKSNTFLRFCYSYLVQFYSNHPHINQDELEITFQNIVSKIKAALVAKDEYFSAVKLLSAYSTCEETVDNYIIASVHMEYVKNCINDECIMLLDEQKDCVQRAKFFLELLEINRTETPNIEAVNSIYKYVDKLTNVDPTMQLCFMYYLTNPVEEGFAFIVYLVKAAT